MKDERIMQTQAPPTTAPISNSNGLKARVTPTPIALPINPLIPHPVAIPPPTLIKKSLIALTIDKLPGFLKY